MMSVFHKCGNCSCSIRQLSRDDRDRALNIWNCPDRNENRLALIWLRRQNAQWSGAALARGDSVRELFSGLGVTTSNSWKGPAINPYLIEASKS